MLEILILLGIGIVLFFVTKAFFRVILYLVIYNLLAALAYLTVGGLINLDGPVLFLASRILFIAAALVIGNRIWEFTKKYQIINAVVLLLFAWMIYRLVVYPPQEYYYHQVPEENYTNYI